MRAAYVLHWGLGCMGAMDWCEMRRKLIDYVSTYEMQNRLQYVAELKKGVDTKNSSDTTPLSNGIDAHARVVLYLYSTVRLPYCEFEKRVRIVNEARLCAVDAIQADSVVQRKQGRMTVQDLKASAPKKRSS